MKNIILSVFALVAMACTTQVYAQKNPMVGGAEMYATKDIVDNIRSVRAGDRIPRGIQQYRDQYPWLVD